MSNNFYFTKTAFSDLNDIFEYSTKNWGEPQAKKYISALYFDFQKIANDTGISNLRKYRSEPFLMYPSNKHYVIYKPIDGGIIIITVINQVRNIEGIMLEFGSKFQNEIENCFK